MKAEEKLASQLAKQPLSGKKWTELEYEMLASAVKKHGYNLREIHYEFKQ